MNSSDVIIYDVFDAVMLWAFSVAFLVAGTGMIISACTGPRKVSWMRYLGAMIGIGFGLWYTLVAWNATFPDGHIVSFQFLANASRVLNTLVLSTLLIWWLGRPDRWERKAKSQENADGES